LEEITMAKRIKKLDFTGVEAYKKCEEGIHTAKLVQMDEGTTQAGDDMLKAIFEVVAGNSKGARVFDNFPLTDKALWKFKMCLSAMGVKCEGKIAVDLDKLIGKTVDIEVGLEEYNGQMRARILDYSKVSVSDDDFDDDDEEDEVEEEPKKKSKKQPEPEEVEDDDDEDWEDA
jgi:hypothetical protein